MNNIFIIPFLLLFLCSCSTYTPRRVASLSKGQHLYNRHFKKKYEHFKCVDSFVNKEVDPIQANTICIDIFRKTF